MDRNDILRQVLDQQSKALNDRLAEVIPSFYDDLDSIANSGLTYGKFKEEVALKASHEISNLYTEFQNKAKDEYFNMLEVMGIETTDAEKRAFKIEQVNQNNIRTVVRHRIDGIFGNGDIDDLEARSKVVADISEKYLPTNIKYKFNDTIASMSYQDIRVDNRWALVPKGKDTCQFCLLLSSNGYVYKKEAWSPHENCDCRLVPYNDKVRPTGYNPEKMQPQMSMIRATLERVYEGIRHRVYSLSADEFVAEFGKISTSDAIKKLEARAMCSEMRTRSTDWIVDGVEPEITYASREVRNRVTSRELATAKNLKKQGASCRFIEDHEQRGGRTIGKPDLENGWEIKTPHETRSQNTVNKYVKNARDKEGTKALVMDNSCNIATDNEMISLLMVAKEQKHFAQPIYIINKKKQLIKIA